MSGFAKRGSLGAPCRSVHVMGEGAPRWRGQPGRLEVWYATLNGLWIHAEVVSPTDGGAAYGHGWAAVFPPDDKPVVERFGPAPVKGNSDVWFDSAGCTVSASALVGRTDTIEWNLSYADDSPTLFTFPRWAWERQVLPAAQVVPWPTASFTGWVNVAGETIEIDNEPGNLARIYGHGNAQRWGWLHADLGNGDVLEIVSAVSRRPGLNKLPPLALVQLRLNGEDWPREPLAAAPLFRTKLGLPTWTVKGRGLDVEVAIPHDRAVVMDYADPDGAPAVCTNSERASARITFKGRTWELDGTAHAEIGER